MIDKWYTISRHQEGVTLNPREYILTDAGDTVRLFTLTEALETLGIKSVEEGHEQGFYIDEYERG